MGIVSNSSVIYALLSFALTVSRLILNLWINASFYLSVSSFGPKGPPSNLSEEDRVPIGQRQEFCEPGDACEFSILLKTISYFFGHRSYQVPKTQSFWRYAEREKKSGKFKSEKWLKSRPVVLTLSSRAEKEINLTTRLKLIRIHLLCCFSCSCADSVSVEWTPFLRYVSNVYISACV